MITTVTLGDKVARRADVAAMAAPREEQPINMLEVFDSYPGSWAIVHAATDNRNAPLICEGDIAVVECNGMTGWYPVEGKLFLIEYEGCLYPNSAYQRTRRTREIVAPYKDRFGKWWVGSLRRPLATDPVIFCSDGPYRDEQTLADRLLGPVVGLLSSTMKGARQ